MLRLAQLAVVLFLVGGGAGGEGQRAASPVAAETAKRPNEGVVGTKASAGPDTRVVVGYFLGTATIKFVDGTKRPAVNVLEVRDDGNLENLNGTALILADNAYLFPQGSESERLSWSGLKPGTRLLLYCTALKDGAYGPPVLKVGVPAAELSSVQRGSSTQTPTGRR